MTDLLQEPLERIRTLPRPKAVRLIDSCRAVLASRGRETDPVTYANPNEVYLLHLNRGLDVAIFGLLHDRRLPIESFFGYVAARNRVPIAYGGGWIFYDRCEIGVNIFDEFRGGESAYIFAQIMRVYHQLFGSRRFTVDPFQFGADNDEGIASGAFWFYYRLGFRPVDEPLASQSQREFDRIRNEPGYRTPGRILRRLASARLELDTQLNPRRLPTAPDLKGIGLAVTDWIARRFKGSRSQATQWAVHRLQKKFRVPMERPASGTPDTGLRRLSILAAMIDDLSEWSRSEQRNLRAILDLKNVGNERSYIDCLAGHKRFHAHLTKLSQRGEQIAHQSADRSH